MGYTGVYGTFRTYKEAFDVVVRTELSDIKFLSVRIVGSVAYCACEASNRRFLMVILMTKSKHDFMYKAIDETALPLYFDFTQKQLDLVSSSAPANTLAEDFRKKVRDCINKKKEEKDALKKAEVLYVMDRKAYLINKYNIIDGKACLLDNSAQDADLSIVKWAGFKDGFIAIDSYGDPLTSYRYHSAERALEAFLEELRR